jgi:hypothetical protein
MPMSASSMTEYHVSFWRRVINNNKSVKKRRTHSQWRTHSLLRS